MKKVLTIILDGFGMREDAYGNAVKNAGMNNFIKLWNNYPHCLLKASEEYIGLADGQPGFSELGHEIIGAGRSIKNRCRDLKERLTYKKMHENEKYNEMINYLKKNHSSNIHLISLISSGGQVSNINYLIKMIDILNKENLPNKVYLDLISDGVDVPRKSVLEFLDKVIELTNDRIIINTLCGRYYALNSDENYQKTKVYYELLFKGEGIATSNLKVIINACYNNRMTDEYIPPIKTHEYSPIMNDDIIFFFDFGRTSQKQIFESMTDQLFDKFNIYRLNNKVYSTYEIDKDLNQNYFFELPPVRNTLCEYLSDLEFTQAKICESTKKHCLTYFLDGLRDNEYKGCDVYIVQSPKVERMDQKPEMNSLTVAKTIIKCMEKDYDFIIANFANPDIVGHTGNYQATINALQAIDVCLEKIIDVADDNFYKIVIVGSHANSDTIINRNNEIVTQNTLSSVPFMIIDKKVKLKNGTLQSVAPTILNYMDIAIPKEMKETELLFDHE